MGVPYGTGLKQSASSVMLYVANMPINGGVKRQRGCPKCVPRLFTFHFVGTPALSVWVFSLYARFPCSLLGMEIRLLYILFHVYCFIS